MKVGIVLGAGGPLGCAYHLGVVEGIRNAIGREPANADRIVATSAGAPIAASVLAGATTHDVLEVITRPPSEADRSRMRAAGGRAARQPLRWLRPMAPNLVGNINKVGVATASVGMLPSGVFPTTPLRRLVTTTAMDWPSSLWVPSVRIDDGEVVVFGRDPVEDSLGDAIEATSAIPGLFQPKLVDGHRYVDGAVASATHADLLIPEQPDVVLISSPMTRPGRGPVRARARRQLATEVAALNAAGARTIVLEPDSTLLEIAEGFPRNRPEAGEHIVAAAVEQTVAAFSERRGPRARHSAGASAARPQPRVVQYVS